MDEFNHFQLIGKLQEDVKLHKTYKNEKLFGSWLISIFNGKEYELRSGIIYVNDNTYVNKFKKGSCVYIAGSIEVMKEKFVDDTTKYTPLLVAKKILFLPKFTSTHKP